MGREVCLGEWKDTWTDRVNGWLNRLMNGERGSGYLMGRWIFPWVNGQMDRLIGINGDVG